ncbi:MAG: SufE family protein [Bacteroidota bacterium]
MQAKAIKSIREIQEEIIEEFSTLEGDRESMLTYIIELGEKMKPLDEMYKNNYNIVKGCMSKVWMIHRVEDNRLFFSGDSNTAITKGLISLLFRILSGQPCNDIIHTSLHFVGKIGMIQLIGSQRASGLGNMIKQIKLTAIQQQGQLTP